jgi:hypothetical protein
MYIKITAFWDVTLYIMAQRYLYFEGTYCLHLQERILVYKDKRLHKYRNITKGDGCI